MKTKIIIVMVFISSIAIAQRGNKNLLESGKALNALMVKMLENAKQETPNLLDLNAMEFYNSIDKRFKHPALLRSMDFLRAVSDTYGPGHIRENYDLGTFKSLQDKAVWSAQNSTSYLEFVNKFTGKDFGDIDKKDADTLRYYYDKFKTINLTNAKFYEETFKKDNCNITIRETISITNFVFPKVDWEFKITIDVNCQCQEATTQSKLKSASYEIKEKTKGFFSSNSMDFGNIPSPKLNILKAEYCPVKTEVLEDASIQITPTENISLPQQTIGGSVGIGFSNDFDETNICLGAEYLYNVTDVGESSLFVGANIMVENNSFNDFNNTWVGVGPTVQLFTPINPSKDVHMTNGISAGYLFGNNDNNGYKDDISGFKISLNTGLNVPLNEAISLSLIVPIITHSNLEFTSQDGGSSFKSDSTDIFFFKNSPVKFGVRIDLAE